MGVDDRLVYVANSRGDTIPDFACVGYEYDATVLPSALEVPAVVEVSPLGDERDSARVQAAIDLASSLPLRVSGFRGAVLLSAGRFLINATLHMAVSGVVLRGAGDGSGSGAATILQATALHQHTVVQVAGDDTYDFASSSGVAVSQDYVPVGAKAINISSVGALDVAVGDLVLVRRPQTPEWVSAIGMDSIRDCTPPLTGRSCSQWSSSSSRFTMSFERRVTAIEGDTTLHLDAPLVQSLDVRFGGATVYKAIERRIERVGVEGLRIVSSFNESLVYRDYTWLGGRSLGDYFYDEQHAWTAVSLQNVRHSFVSRLTCVHLGYACVDVKSGAKHVTVSSVTSLEPVSILTGGRRYPFNVDGSQAAQTEPAAPTLPRAWRSASVHALINPQR